MIFGGVVAGTWTRTGDEVAVSCFAEAGTPPPDALTEEVRRLGTILGRPLRLIQRNAPGP